MNEPPSPLAALQARLGYRFHDEALLLRALTHRSCGGGSNERLEFLGDSVLGMCISAELFARFPGADEGGMTRMRANLVCNPALAETARALRMRECMRAGAGAAKTGAQETMLSGALEAVFGAVYLDGGADAARELAQKLFAAQLRDASPHAPKDHKTRLQERLQKHGLPPPQYALLAREGKPHAPAFTVQCAAEGIAPVTAAGGSRRAAEQLAAQKALALLDV